MRKVSEKDKNKIYETIERVLSDLALLELMIIEEDVAQDADDNTFYRLIGTAGNYIMGVQELYSQKSEQL